MPTISNDVANLSEILWMNMPDGYAEALEKDVAELRAKDPDAEASLRVLETFIIGLKERLDIVMKSGSPELGMELGVTPDLMTTLLLTRSVAMEQYALEAKFDSDAIFALNFTSGNIWQAKAYGHEFLDILGTVYDDKKIREIVETIWDRDVTPPEEQYDAVSDWLAQVRKKQNEQ